MSAVTTEIERFKTEATRAGFVVYEAKDAGDATGYVLKLAQERGAKHVVKSKSTLAAQLSLRWHLEKAGIEVTETDMEEWIAQLAGGNMQTGQKGVEQIARLISRATGEEVVPDPQVLLNAANRFLKQACINADLGISEADIAIAETGTLVLTGSEGSTRLVAVLPRFHLTLVECENIVPTMEDAVLKIRSPGEDMTNIGIPSYVTYITGRNTTADIPGAILARAQGPAEEHIVLVSNAGKRGVR